VVDGGAFKAFYDVFLASIILFVLLVASSAT